MTFSCCSGTWDQRPPPSSGGDELLPAGSALNLGGGSAARVRFRGTPAGRLQERRGWSGASNPLIGEAWTPRMGESRRPVRAARRSTETEASHRSPSPTRHQDQGSSLAPSALVGVRVVVPDLK